jgi:peroxiredoxin
MSERTLDVGDSAPDFSIRDHNEALTTLSEFKGKNVVLSFHGLAWTSVCQAQMQDLEKYKEGFDLLNAVALGISVDSVPCKKAWASHIGIKETRLLSDFWPHGGVADSYGVFLEDKGISNRVVFIVDKEGVIRFKKIYPMSQVPDIDGIMKALKEIEGC